MESTKLCFILGAAFLYLCAVSSSAFLRVEDDPSVDADNTLEDRYNSRGGRSRLCVNGSCQGRQNGNYASCSADCADGYYFTCSNGYAYKMQCPLGWYTSVEGNDYTAHMLYVPEVDSCQLEANYCRTESIFTFRSNSGACVSDSCADKSDGNYPSCTVQCQTGYYFSCSNGILYKMQCPLGWYTAINGTRYTAPTVYVPEVDSCLLEAKYCRILG